MNTFLSWTLLLFFMTIFCHTNAQWYIIKKDFPSNLMNYPNPGKRSLSDDELNIPCPSLDSYFQFYQNKPIWLLPCRRKKSSLIAIDDLSSSSSSDSNSIEDEIYSTPRLISHERRTVRSPPPYFNDRNDLFNIRLLKRLRRPRNK